MTDLAPQLNADIADHSCVDDSIKQDGVTINASGHATINSNSGNGRANKVGVSELAKVLLVSIVCDAILCWFLWSGHASTMRKLETFSDGSQRVDKMMEVFAQEQRRLDEQHRDWVEKSKREHEEMLRQAKEGNIWIIRYDIMRTIDLFEVKGQMTAREYTRLKDEYQYYKSIGGNHDVQERFDSFTARILSGKVKVMNE